MPGFGQQSINGRAGCLNDPATTNLHACSIAANPSSECVAYGGGACGTNTNAISSRAYLKAFKDWFGVYQNNTTYAGTHHGALYGIQLKQPSRGSTVQFNNITNGELALGGDCTGGCPEGLGITDVVVRGNIAPAIVIEGAVSYAINNLYFDHNTIYDSGGVGVKLYRNTMTIANGLRFTNNIVNATDKSWTVEYRAWDPVAAHIPATWAFKSNAYRAAATFHPRELASDPAVPSQCTNVGGTSECATLAAWASALNTTGGCSGCETNSIEADCSFVSSGDYHLVSGTSCRTMATTDGKEVGAYGAAACIGANCPVGSGSTGVKLTAVRFAASVN